MNRAVLLGYVRLMRPANLPTAAADILAGAAVAGAIFYSPIIGNLVGPELLMLVAASVCLYAGGVVLNDVFDLPVDRTERPERPIPSGLVPKNGAALFGSVLLLAGVLFALSVHLTSGLIAFVLALAILLYDSLSKKHGFFGPLNMGICRGLNLLLGMSILSLNPWPISFIPVIYIFAITLISRGEVHGENKNHLLLSGVLYAAVIASIVYVIPDLSQRFLLVAPFLAAFGFMIYRPLINAYLENSPGNIKKAVISGVLGLILMDAALATTFGPWWYGVLIILLLPLSFGLSKMFAVT